MALSTEAEQHGWLMHCWNEPGCDSQHSLLHGAGTAHVFHCELLVQEAMHLFTSPGWASQQAASHVKALFGQHGPSSGVAAAAAMAAMATAVRALQAMVAIISFARNVKPKHQALAKVKPEVPKPCPFFARPSAFPLDLIRAALSCLPAAGKKSHLPADDPRLPRLHCVPRRARAERAGADGVHGGEPRLLDRHRGWDVPVVYRFEQPPVPGQPGLRGGGRHVRDGRRRDCRHVPASDHDRDDHDGRLRVRGQHADVPDRPAALPR